MTGNGNTRKLAVCAMCIALSTVTGMIRLFSLPNGGSITLFSMLFAALPGFFFGLRWGVTAGVGCGVVNFILKPYFYTPIQFVCDYILAFGALGLSGLFRKQKHGLLTGYLVACFGRFVFSFISGFVFFGEYAPEGMHPAVYSAGYNGSYIGVEAALTVAVLMIPSVRNVLVRYRKKMDAEQLRPENG